MDFYDGIILGTGHNALVLQAYLSRCGLSTLSLDRADRPGGGLVTREHPGMPGFLCHPHAFFHRGISRMPWYTDLQLRQHGVEFLEPELNTALILRDGRALEWWTDLERTESTFAEFSKRDALQLRRWVDEFRPIVKEILIPEAQSPPLPAQRREALLRQSVPGRRLLEVSRLSPLEFVLQEFEHDVIRAGLLFFNGLREVDLRLPGFGHAIPALLASPAKAQLCVGGSQRLAEGLVTDIESKGGRIRCGVALQRILWKGGRAAGIELASGEQIQARSFVVSGLNPQQTLLELLPEEAVPSEVRRQAAGFRYNLLAPLFSLHVALDEPPLYSAAAARPELARAFMVILGLERFGQFEEIVKAHEDGRIPPTVAWGACPSLFDPGQAPEGRHTAFLWEKVPYALAGDAGRWRSEQAPHGRELLRFWSEFAPNLAGGAVLDSFTRTPLDIEANLPNMRNADLLVGSFENGQVGFHRPFAGAGRYRTPVEGLYLCGGSTHPGGNITGLCGYNAARVIVSDLEMHTWWDPPDLEKLWEP